MTPFCPLCKSRETAFYCAKAGFRIFACRSCTNGFLDLPPGFNPSDWYKTGYHKKEDLSDTKGYDDYYAMAPGFERTFSNRLRDLLALQKDRRGPLTLLDVGCGPGFFMKLAASRYEVTGVELGREAVQHARERLGLRVIDEEFRAGLFEPGGFDAVTMFDVIEHLPEPARAVEDAGRLLKPGGVLMLTTGDFSSLAARLCGTRWHLINPPDHLFYFTRRGLEELLARLGLEVLETRYPHGHFTLDYAAERIAKSLMGRLGAAYRVRRGLRARLSRLVLPLNLWDIMLITARKPR